MVRLLHQPLDGQLLHRSCCCLHPKHPIPLVVPLRLSGPLQSDPGCLISYKGQVGRMGKGCPPHLTRLSPLDLAVRSRWGIPKFLAYICVTFSARLCLPTRGACLAGVPSNKPRSRLASSVFPHLRGLLPRAGGATFGAALVPSTNPKRGPRALTGPAPSLRLEGRRRGAPPRSE